MRIQVDKVRPQIGCNLWSINRWLRFLGFRIYVTWDPDVNVPTKIGLIWYGWSTIKSEGW